MGHLKILPLLVGLALASSVFASTPIAAKSMVDDAVKTAKSEHKGVLVIFHASWCGWCKQLDKTLEMPEFKAIMDKDYVILHVTVEENAAHKTDENPGGEDLMKQLGGEKAGLPFFATLDGDGKKVGDSKVVEGTSPTPQNMGFPTETVEITKFLELLKGANPELSDADAATLHKILDSRAAEIKASQKH